MSGVSGSLSLAARPLGEVSKADRESLTKASKRGEVNVQGVAIPDFVTPAGREARPGHDDEAKVSGKGALVLAGALGPVSELRRASEGETQGGHKSLAREVTNEARS